jgi:hypothetical protein
MSGPQNPRTLAQQAGEERPREAMGTMNHVPRTVPFDKAKEPLMSGVQLFFSISSLEFSSQAYSTAVLVDL